MLLRLNFLDSEILRDKAPCFYKITGGSLVANWDREFLPKTGESFDFWPMISEQMLNKIPVEEKDLFYKKREVATVVRIEWYLKDQCIIDIRLTKEYIQPYPMSSLRHVVVYTPELANISFDMEWNADIFPHVGDKFKFGSFLTENEINRFLVFYLKNIREFTQMVGQPVLHLQKSKDILDAFNSREECSSCELSKVKADFVKKGLCNHLTKDCFESWLEEIYKEDDTYSKTQLLFKRHNKSL